MYYLGYIIVAAIALLIGGAVVFLITKKMAQSGANRILEEAKLEADGMKKNKLLELKEAE